MSIVHDRPIYPMRVVLRRTGLSPDLLRAWERRYGVVAPGRTAGGQRLYSEADVERLTLLRRATYYGHAISQLAGLDNPAIEGLVAEASTDLPVGNVGNGGGESGAIVAECLESIEWMDGAGLDTTLRRAALSMGPVRFAEAVVSPLAKAIGDRWHAGELRIVQEHLATGVIRQVVGSLLSFGRVSSRAPVIVTATPTGQHHEVGAMLAAMVAASRGWHPVYLGPDLAGEEIAVAVERSQASAAGLSLVYPLDDAAVDEDLRTLAQAVGGRIPMFVGGPAAAERRPLLDRLGFSFLPNLSSLVDRLAPVAS
jgi:MerR family transcriptional regulator, light-induced transcriptional regulator